MSIADKLTLLQQTKENIRSAVNEIADRCGLQGIIEGTPFSYYPDVIRGIPTGTDTSDATATAADLLSGKTAYGPRGKLTGAVAGVAQAAPVIAVSDGGLITASVTQDAGLLAPDSDNFAEIYGMNIGAGEFKEVTFSLPGFKTAFSINNTTSIGDVATRLNWSLPDFGYTAAYNTVTGKLVITDKYGAVADFTVTDKNGTVLEPKYTAVKSATQQLASFTLPLPTISVSSGGLITASAATSKGYYPDGSNSATKQLTTQGAATITPGTYAKTAVASGRYTTGAVTVAGDANLAAGNIRSGVSIFGVAGNYAPSLPAAAVTVRTNIPMLNIGVGDPNGNALNYGIGSSFGTYSISFATTLNGLVLLNANKQTASPPAPTGSGFQTLEYGPCSGKTQLSYVFAVLRITSPSADITWNP